MKWFLVKYIYQIISGTGCHQDQYDEQLRLIVASDFVFAFHKAVSLADSFNPSFINFKGESVDWKFVGLLDLTEIQDPADGTEVNAILHEPEDITAFLNRIELCKRFLQQRILDKNDMNNT